MSGPRKAALVAGVYAAGTLGSVQRENRSNFFRRTKDCRMGRHQWLFGAECAVCSVCGETVEKSKVERVGS